MKKAILLIFVAFVARDLHSQNWPTAGSYTTNNTMGAFHGTWRWTSGSDTAKIFLMTKKVFVDINGGYHWDLLVGWHIYKSGNTVIESSYPYINVVSGRTFTGSNEDEPIGVVTGSIKDILKNKEGKVTLTLNAAQNQMTWELENSPGLKVRGPGQPPHQPGFTLPQNMVLIKQ